MRCLLEVAAALLSLGWISYITALDFRNKLAVSRCHASPGSLATWLWVRGSAFSSWFWTVYSLLPRLVNEERHDSVFSVETALWLLRDTQLSFLF